MEVPSDLQTDYRLTIDTQKDLEMMRRLFDEILNAGMEINLENALGFLSEHSDIADINTRLAGN